MFWRVVVFLGDENALCVPFVRIVEMVVYGKTTIQVSAKEPCRDVVRDNTNP